MMMFTAREWLDTADFDLSDPSLRESLVQRVGYDKADETMAAMQRISETVLDSLGNLMLSDTSIRYLLRAVSSIAIDNHLPEER